MANISRLHDALTAAGIPVDSVSQTNGVLAVQFSASATPQQIASGQTIVADFPFASAKYEKLRAINSECTQRILAVWPIEKQVSALAGIYGATQRSQMETMIGAHIDASNTASDAVTAATTIAEVEAVTVTWPV